MKILYYSCLVSQHLLDELINQSKGENLPAQSIQKFHRLLITGLKKYCKVKCISSIPFSNHRINLDKYNPSKDLDFLYTSKYNKGNFVRQILNFLMSFYFTLKEENKVNNIAIFDYLNFSLSLGGYLACKLKNIPTVVIVTDFPDLMVNQSSVGFVTKLKYKWLNSFNGYILLSEYMNEIINKNNKPYLIMEGLVDSSYQVSIPHNKEKVVLYAGGLYSKYGINKLVDAFLKTKNDYELHLYGNGDSVPYIEELAQSNPRIKYFGMVANKIIVDKISKCTLLVNPRPSDLALSRYSFPSKNLEYMLSGTPLLTTKLPSIPIDHYPYVYFFEEETKVGFENTLNTILNKPLNELYEKGVIANSYVLKNKSNLIQGKRIYTFLDTVYEK